MTMRGQIKHQVIEAAKRKKDTTPVVRTQRMVATDVDFTHLGRGTKRKPHNDTAGYVASRKAIGDPSLGVDWLLIIDRENGGDWVDAPHRWVLVWTLLGTFVSYTSLAHARRDIKAAATDPQADVWVLLDRHRFETARTQGSAS